MPVKGYKSYFIMGEQAVDWDTAAATLRQYIYEFLSFGLRGTGDNIIPTRFQRNPSPPRPVRNFVGAEGPIAMHLHAEDMLIIFKHILMDTAVASVDFTEQEVFGNGAGSQKALPGSPFSLDTQPTATDPVSAPGQMHVTLAASDSGTMTFTGTNWGGQTITEQLTFSTESEKTTTKFFKTIATNGVAYSGLTQDCLIEADRGIYTHTIQEGDDVDDGLTIEAVKGALPSVYIGALLNSGTIDIADVVTFTVNAIAKQEWDRYKFVASNDPSLSDTPTDVSGYSRISDLVFPAWTVSVDFDASGTPTPVASASFLFNNQLGYPTRFRGIRTQPKPVRTDNREITMTVAVDYESAAEMWSDKFLCLDDIEVDFYMETAECSGALRSVNINMPRCNIGASPSAGVDSYSEVLQELVLRPIRTSGATTSDEVEIVVESVESGI